MGEREERHGPAKEQRHVGRDDAGRERHAGERREREAGNGAGARVVETASEQKDGERRPVCTSGDGRRTQSSEGPQRGREPDQPGDERGLGVVAEGRLEAPGPVLRLVEEEVRAVEGERDQPQDEQGRQQPREHPVQRSSVAGSAPAVVIAAMSPPERAEPWTVAAWPQFGSFTLLERED